MLKIMKIIDEMRKYMPVEDAMVAKFPIEKP
jgi:hypothetical protein